MDKKLLGLINGQINAELYAAYLYLSMSTYFEDNNLPGFANWMKLQAQEEQEHAMKFFNHLLDRGQKVELEKIDKPKSNWGNAVEVFEDALSHEKLVTKMINDIFEMSETVKDRPSRTMLQWFIDEQVEEEDQTEKILDDLKKINEDGPGMLYLDRELAGRK